MKKMILLALVIAPLYLSAQTGFPTKDGRLHLDTVIELRQSDRTKLMTLADAWFSNNFSGKKSEVLHKDVDGFKGIGNYAMNTFLGNGSTIFLCCFKMDITFLEGGKARVQFYDYRLNKNGGYWKAEHWIAEGKKGYVKQEFRTKTVQSMYDYLASLQNSLNAG
jgi:hypothetical protein